MIIDNDREKRGELASELERVSESIQQYPHINKVDKQSIYSIGDLEGYDVAFIRISGTQKNPEEFEPANYTRKQNQRMEIVFYSEELTNDVAKYLYEYFPVNYLQIPLDSNKIEEIVKNAKKKHEPIRMFIKTKQGCAIRNATDIRYFDIKKNVIYADECIEVSNSNREYQKYIINMLQTEGFVFYQNRYWVNRYQNMQD